MMEDQFMLRKYLLFPALVSLACLLAATNSAQAQHHHGGGSHHGGSGHNGGSWNHGGGHVHFGAFFYPGLYSGYNYPWASAYYPSYYPATSYYYPARSYYYYPAVAYDNPSTTYYYPSTTYNPSTSAYYSPTDYATTDTATVRVLVPDSRARVWFNGNLTRQNGMDRSFQTPPLTSGYNYSYIIRATWMQNGREMTQERTLSVMPGRNFVVNFMQPAAEQIPGY